MKKMKMMMTTISALALSCTLSMNLMGCMAGNPDDDKYEATASTEPDAKLPSRDVLGVVPASAKTPDGFGVDASDKIPARSNLSADLDAQGEVESVEPESASCDIAKLALFLGCGSVGAATACVASAGLLCPFWGKSCTYAYYNLYMKACGGGGGGGGGGCGSPGKPPCK